MSAELIEGDCLESLRKMKENSIDAIVTDPPYGLSFMGKKWDYDVPSEAIWRECLRVLKPGGHLLAFAGTRTQHRMAVRIEDAGFEIRDMIAWVYGSGFPKSLDVSKAIDKAAGAERERVGPNKFAALNGKSNANCYGEASRPDETAPATAAARHWQGWGTALKPALEPITMARKPLVGTVAENVLTHGTGAINVDGCRVETSDTYAYPNGAGGNGFHGGVGRSPDGSRTAPAAMSLLGRWPANVIHDGSEEVVGLFPDTKGGTAIRRNSGGNTFGGSKLKPPMEDLGYADSGSAARFFYCAKASKADRDEGCEGLGSRFAPTMGNGIGGKEHDPETATPKRNHHPTVKPTALMRYLCRLVTPPGGIVLDPFMGSGSTGKAAVLEGFNFIGIEREAEYVEIARARISAVQPTLL